jgi:hypothetical protein
VTAVDLRPGTPSIVRSATVEVVSPASAPEPLLALWLPGDAPVRSDAGTAFELPAGATLRVRVHYRKTWQYERQAMRDRSTIGLYFADRASTAVRTLVLAPDPAAGTGRGRLSFTRTLDGDLRVLAVYPNEALAGSDVTVAAIGPDGARQPLIAFRPRAGWLRRFWFREPIALRRGTRLEATVSRDDEGAALPLSAAPGAPPAMAAGAVSLTLNVVPEP